MITSIYFDNFKAFGNYSISFRDFNILTGPNNHGKSTALDAFRILKGAYGHASRFNPTYHNFPNGYSGYGYTIPKISIPIMLENIQTNYESEFSRIRFRFEDGQNLYLLFTNELQTYLYFDTPRKIPLSSSTFRKEFSLNIYVIPTLGPLEIDEELLNEDYVKQWSGSRRAPRMFRSYWFYNPENFEQFREMLEKTWEGMSIKLPEKKNVFSKELVMFYYENRLTREICWAGFGFQIWIQLLTHIIKAQNSDIVIVDEPEIYLHPELQHKVLEILKEQNMKIVLATHSVEIINNAEPADVLVIDKTKKSGKRISDLGGLQQVSNLLGSGQNIQLAKLIRGKKLLFVEGYDAKILAKFSKITKHNNLFNSGDITIIPIEGFSKHDKILATNWAFTKILGEELKIAALFDRDYRTEEEIENLKEKFQEIDYLHILCRKEIENYIIIPNAIAEAINERLAQLSKSNDLVDVATLIFDLADTFKTHVFAQYSSKEISAAQKGKKDITTVISEFSIKFEKNWKNLDYRIKVVPGKLFLSALNENLQKNYGVSITITQIINKTKIGEIDNDISTFMDNLMSFKNA